MRQAADRDTSFHVGVTKLLNRRPKLGRLFYVGVRVSTDKLF